MIDYWRPNHPCNHSIVMPRTADELRGICGGILLCWQRLRTRASSLTVPRFPPVSPLVVMNNHPAIRGATKLDHSSRIWSAIIRNAIACVSGSASVPWVRPISLSSLTSLVMVAFRSLVLAPQTAGIFRSRRWIRRSARWGCKSQTLP